MNPGDADARWRTAAIARAVIVGAAVAIVGLAGSSLVLPEVPGARDAIVFAVTAIVVFCVGLWAGSPDARREELPLRDRWISAAALTAVAGAFATFATLYQQIYPGGIWPIAALLVGIAAPIYALGLLPPLLLTWADRVAATLDDPPAPWTVAGTLALGLLLGAAVGLAVGGLAALPRLSAGSVLMATAVILLLPLVLPDPGDDIPRETLIHGVVTPYGTLSVTEVTFPRERQPERRLYLNEEEESGELVRSGAPTLAYVAAAEQLLADVTPPGGSYLFLGGGAYTLPRRIAERDPNARVLVVELDPEVTRVAYRFFGLEPHHRIGSVHGDARAYLESAGDAAFDRIYVDVYGGREALPHSLVTREAALTLRRHLEPGGILAMNLIGTVVGEEIRQVWSIVETFADVFPRLAVYTHLGRDYPDRQNLLLVAGDESSREPPASIGMFERWPEGEWPRPEGTTQFHDVQPYRAPAENTPRPLPTRGARAAGERRA
jgi:hypothetical protein